MASRLSLESSARRTSLSGTSRPVLRRPVTRTWRVCQHRFKRRRQRNSKQFKDFRQFTFDIGRRGGFRLIPDISQKNLFDRARQDFGNKLGDAGFKAFIIVGGRQRRDGCQKKLKYKLIYKCKPQQRRDCQQKRRYKLIFKPQQFHDCQQKFRHKLLFKPQQRKFDIKFFQKSDLQQTVLGRLRLHIQRKLLKFVVPQRFFDKELAEFKLLQFAVIDPQQFKLLIQQEFLKFIVPQQRLDRRQPFFRRRQEQLFGRRRKAEIAS